MSVCRCNARIKRLVCEPHRAVHICKVIPALRIVRLQANSELQERDGVVNMAFDGGAGAAFGISSSVRVCRTDGGFVPWKCFKESGEHGPTGRALPLRMKRNS